MKTFQQGQSHQVIYKLVENLTQNAWSGVALDAGCGQGHWSQHLNDSKKFLKVEQSDIVDLRLEPKNIATFRQCDLAYADLPYASSELDWIFAVEVLEHLANPRKFVGEAARCLKSGGYLVLTTPCNESVRSLISFIVRGYFAAFHPREYHENGHITALTQLDIIRMAQESKLKVERVAYSNVGMVPGLNVTWQKILPFLKGKRWSDNFVVILTKK